jgi:hypothetical protein
VPSCGDGYLNPAFSLSIDLFEQCDDGSANNDSKANACRTNCQKAHCGDGVKDSGEECEFLSPMCGSTQKCNILTCQCE